jgi:ribose 1,5-bisphosphokinase
MSGRLIAVVGPSGVGKDSLIDALAARRPGLGRVRRAITRPAEAGGEPFEALSEAGFASRAEAGGFLLWWRAHGLCYGIPAEVGARLEAGEDLLANLSRRVLPEAAARVSRLAVLHLTAPPEVLATRLAARRREDAAQIADRMERRVAHAPLPPGVPEIVIDNSGPLDRAVGAALAALYPTQARP